MKCRRAVYILRCAGQRARSQGHKIKNAYSAISNQLYTIFFCYFSTYFCETWLVYRQYLVHLPCVTVRHHTECGQCYNLQIARYSLNNSSIHATYILPTRQKAKTSLINVPGRFHQELGWWKPTKAKDAQPCITLYITIHHSMLCYYFRHTTDFIGQNTRGRSPHASLDINTTPNYCPVSEVISPRSSVGRASDARFRGPWIKSHKCPTFFILVHLLKVCSIQPKKAI